MYVHELAEWPKLNWNIELLQSLLEKTRVCQNDLFQKLAQLGFEDRNEASLRIFTEDVLKTSEIEGETLDPAQVRSSLARKLGLDIGGLLQADRNVEGIVEVVLDASRNFATPLTVNRLCGWHAALFPTGFSGTREIRVGKWRDDANGPMEVVSGPYGNRRVHFEAPSNLRIPEEMERFLVWFEQEDADIDPILKAGVSHFYFVTIHPFDDGNGRLARAIADLALARADRLGQRFYSMSAQINVDKDAYYSILERTQKATLDVTSWLEWFLNCLIRAIERAEILLQDVLRKARIWRSANQFDINERQKKIINKLLDGAFTGNLNAPKYAKLVGCSADTANRDLSLLVEFGVLEKGPGQGKSTNYTIKDI